MNYYERHLGDYARDAGHLSMLEHGAYSMLLDRCYITEAGIPADQAYRLARAKSAAERAAVDSVLNEFFTLVDGVWINGRANREIEKAQSRINAARSNGKSGGRPKSQKKQASSEPSGLLLGSEMETQAKAHQTPDTKHQIPVKTNTARKRAAPAVLVSVEDMVREGVDRQHATDWLVNRKTKGLSQLTPSIWGETKAEAQKAGLTIAAAIKAAAGEGWGGFKAKWLTGDRNGTAPVPGVVSMDGVH